MATKWTKSTANVASKWPHQRTDLEIEVSKDDEGGKLVEVIAHQLGMSPSTMATISKNKNNMIEAVKSLLPSRLQDQYKFKNNMISTLCGI